MYLQILPLTESLEGNQSIPMLTSTNRLGLLTKKPDEDLGKWGGLTPQQVMVYVKQLPEIYRLVLNMYAVDGFSHQEIADKLGISVGSSKSRLSRARVILKENIRKDSE